METTTAPTAPNGSPDSIAPKHSPENRGRTADLDQMRKEIVEHIVHMLGVTRNYSIAGVRQFSSPDECPVYVEQMSDSRVRDVYTIVNRSKVRTQ